MSDNLTNKMEKMLSAIETAIEKEYKAIQQRGQILGGIEDLYRQVRFENPELAIHIKKRMLLIAKKRGYLP